MTRKRRFLISAAVLAACVCIALGALAKLPPSGVTKANFEQIKVGMTRTEANEILGKPSVVIAETLNKGGAWEEWQNANGSRGDVHFRHDDVVDEIGTWTDSTFLNKLRRWLAFRNDACQIDIYVQPIEFMCKSLFMCKATTAAKKD